MAKQLRDIVKKGSDKASLVPNTLGGYAPKAGDEQRFVAKHIIQKHADRNGNDKGVFDSGKVDYDLNFTDEKRHGRKRGEDAKVYEAVEKEDTKCNMSEEGTMCEVHGMASCKKAKPLTEGEEDEREAGQHYSKDTTSPSMGKASNKMKQDAVSSGTDAGNKSKNSSKADEPSKPAKPSAMAESEGDDSEEDKDVKRVTDIRSKMNAATDPAEKEKYKKQHAAVMSTFNRIPEEVEQVDEAGSFSYGKPPRKGSSAWNAIQVRKKQDRERDKDPEKRKEIENIGSKNHHSGTAKVLSKEEVELDEVLGKDQPAKEWIHDFVHSDNPKFEGKSKKKRAEMALAAYYSKQREKKN